MPSIYDLKPRFQAFLRPIVRALASVGVTANQVTIAAVLISFIGGAFIAWQPHARWPLLVLPLMLFMRMGLNAIDGMLAREHAQQSQLGAILNELGDVIADAALYLPLALLPHVCATLVVLLVLLATISEMMGVVAIQIGAKRQFQGPMGKSDRAFWLGAIALALGAGVLIGAWMNWALVVMLLLLVVTIINRAKGALQETTNAK
ncbi:MAG: CDP-alcohol phosphatidyltransferase family protein [Methylotenera sp.]|uniref:CDP-alcohol phosphatidyltransferase family protein n=1 Tax=Methylotenera sp. TaxID=2051956 RepID=UPI00182DBE60|nr:CDP-alcohol phosphatidyltransferase family protein [Methylotenera sp.]NOU26179.1 CDP-alcohol phosphatidyltransferase family protein [Methylotenera sp.]